MSRWCRRGSMGSRMLLPVLLSCVGLISASNPFEEFRSNFELYDTNLDNPNYRLLDNVQPTYQEVDLDVYLDESRINGRVTIHVTVRESLAQIVLHQNLVAINTVTVTNATGSSIPLQDRYPFETDSYYEILKINLASAISPGDYILEIGYLGRINENPVDRGFYKGYYYYNNEKRYYATTQFQPYHARKAFPCFDEPQFKSQYVISITRDSNLGQSYSNMAIGNTETVNGRIKETFLPTPIISAYLIAFHVSDFVETNATGTAEKPLGIISRPGVTNQHPYAADMGVKITQVLDDYLSYGYYEMGQGQPMKNDHIALPDFPSGAMENWGMVNYREAYLLYDENETNLSNKIFIATIIAHELAHKWFGNLVTCFWWSNLWLNESFASFFEYFAAHAADNDLELADQFVVDYVHSALSADASAGATSMNLSSVASNPSITSHFSTTSYAKGASVLRMMEHFVGADTFQKALTYYIRDNAYGLGTPDAMYTAFRQAVSEDTTFATTYPGIDVGAVFDSWVQNPGAPVVFVDVNMNNGQINITQQRFQLTGNVPNTLWQIPISWTESRNPSFESTKPAFVLTERSRVVNMEPGHAWVILNIAQSGLYRVNYDDHNWEMIASALRSDRTVVNKLNRAQIVNDVLFFLRAGQISVTRAFDVLSFLKEETDYYVWAGALSQLDWLRRRMEHIPEAHEQFSEYMLELMESVIDHLGYEEKSGDSTSTILNRMQIMNYACNNLGHQGCIDYALERWRAYRANDQVLVNVNERRYVYCVGIREGNRTDYDFLFQKYNTSENTADMVVILRTLACTKDAATLRHYLDESQHNDKIRIHDKTNAFSFALQGNPENLQTVLTYLYANYRDIIVTYGGASRFNTAISALSTYLTDFQDILAFQSWLYANQLQLPESFNTGVSVINTSVNNLLWGNNIVVELYGFLLGRNSAVTTSASFVVLSLAAFVNFFKYF